MNQGWSVASLARFVHFFWNRISRNNWHRYFYRPDALLSSKQQRTRIEVNSQFCVPFALKWIFIRDLCGKRSRTEIRLSANIRWIQIQTQIFPDILAAWEPNNLTQWAKIFFKNNEQTQNKYRVQWGRTWWRWLRRDTPAKHHSSVQACSNWDSRLSACNCVVGRHTEYNSRHHQTYVTSMRCTLGNNTANYSYNKWLHHRRHVDGSVVFDRWCQCVPPSNTSSLGLPDSASQMASWSVQPFSHSSHQTVPILYNGPPLRPENRPFTWRDLDPI